MPSEEAMLEEETIHPINVEITLNNTGASEKSVWVQGGDK